MQSRSELKGPGSLMNCNNKKNCKHYAKFDSVHLQPLLLSLRTSKVQFSSWPLRKKLEN